jgi:hypothetical protein
VEIVCVWLMDEATSAAFLPLRFAQAPPIRVDSRVIQHACKFGSFVPAAIENEA